MQAAMTSLRQRLSDDPNADPLIWPIYGELACSQRPLRDHPKYCDCNPLPPEAAPLVVAWIERISSAGIKSVICLLTPEQLGRYDNLPRIGSGLLNAYREAGMVVLHIPVFDQAHPESTDGCEILGPGVYEKAYAGFNDLPKPVLLHCSAGIDRTSPVAADIALKLKKQLFLTPKPAP
jgi:hypothetical protein